MRLQDGRLVLSPTDLSYFLSCRHRTALEMSVAHGVRKRPVWDDPLLEAIMALGREHEREYVKKLEAAAKALVDLSDVEDREEAVARTLSAMRDGVEVIIQGALASDRWYGRPDVLLRVNSPSRNLGAWSYEVADTKLARETRGGTILQLGVYCEMLETVQGLAPEHFYVVTPNVDPIANDGRSRQMVWVHRFDDYGAYFRLMKARLEEAAGVPNEELAAVNYPEPVDHCDICPWIRGCRDRRRIDDHLSLVAGISRLQRRELMANGVTTVEALAAVGEPIPFKPARGALETYERVRDQARVQVQTRIGGKLVYELIPLPAPDQAASDPVGLARLPEPSPGDVFLDLEGDPLAADGGREYLFGIVTIQPGGEVRYDRWWAETADGERRAFEAVVDLIMARRDQHPGMHVYHYAPYEPSAFKRLMGRYATREREIDTLLRGRRFVDLYGVVRQSVRAGVERYSIKNMEPLYSFTRDVELHNANRALRVMEQALEHDRLDLVTSEIREVVQGYNRDDCVSTLRLRDWLEERRDELVAGGATIARPPIEPGEPSKELDEREKRVEALRQKLLALSDAPDGGAGFSPPPECLLAYILDFHRREDRAEWWEYFRLRELPEEDLLEERKAVAGLKFVGEVQKIKRSFVHCHGYPEQELELHRGDTLKMQDGKEVGELVDQDRSARTLDILVGPSRRHLRPTALFVHDHVNARVIENALFALGERVAEDGGVAELAPGPARALLLREIPRLSSGAFDPPPPDAGQGVTDYAVGIVTELDRTALAIQGPPGSGKTYTGARMICELVKAGRKVGVTAMSHKVIVNLLEAVAKESAKQKLDVHLGHKGEKEKADHGHMGGEAPASPDVIRQFSDNGTPLAALQDGEVNVLGGTAWLWARPEYQAAVDVLFVDEAGQMSLANVLGVAPAAGSLVLLGDPQQLQQPSKGSHPDGVAASALQHILGDAQTMPEERGLFLPVTWRLAPPICTFTSELFYAGRLTPKPGLEHQRLRGNGRFEGSGLWFVEVEHDGNRNASEEEAAEVARIAAALLASGSEWVDEEGTAHQIQPNDIRIVAPFNAHVARIQDALKAAGSAPSDEGAGFSPPLLADVPVGTVDKFQGQEAPVVIYSMATSRPEDAPRGMEFLYSLNRLNVATSRARCADIIVASPRLAEPECSTPRQMRLANALCLLKELGEIVRPVPRQEQ